MSYEYWQAALKGTAPTPNVDDPQPGFYRMKRNGSWIPVAVWPTRTGLGFKIGAEVVDQRTGTERWNWFCAHPITEDTYRAVAERGENWPDADPKVAEILEKYPPKKISTGAAFHPKPRSPGVPNPEADAEMERAFMAVDETRSGSSVALKVSDLPEYRLDPVTEIKEQITAALGGVAAYAKIETDEANTRAAGLRNMLMKLSGDAEKDGKALYDPHYRKYKEIYDKWNPLVKLASDGALKLRKAMERYQDDKREAAREAQRRAEAERLRIERERIAAEIQAQIDGKPSPEPVEMPPVTVQSNLPPPDAQVRPTFGKAANVGTHEVVTAIDAEVVFQSFKTHPKVIALLTELAQASINAGIVIPGATHETRTKIK